MNVLTYNIKLRFTKAYNVDIIKCIIASITYFDAI